MMCLIRIVTFSILFVNLFNGTAKGVRIESFGIVNTNRVSQSGTPSEVYHNKYETMIELRNLLRIRGGDDTIRTSVTEIGEPRQTELIQSTDLKSFATSLLAGSIAGALGIGIAYPLDTLKTKQQVMMPSSISRNMFQMFYIIYMAEGIGGFYGGVKVMMIGQAILKSVAFTANSMALSFLKYRETRTTISQTWTSLLLAAMFAGFITSFLTVPFERIKVMMQAQKKSQGKVKKIKGHDKYYTNEMECLNAILRQEGISGLMLRGLGTTLAREVPSFMIYFVAYALFIQSEVIKGPLAPLVGGAFAGCACWIPVYPVDVVKTIVQNTDGGVGTKSAYQIAIDLYRTGGIGAFFDGLTPKMLRAAINHAVTFFLYDNIVAAAM